MSSRASGIDDFGILCRECGRIVPVTLALRMAIRAEGSGKWPADFPLIFERVGHHLKCLSCGAHQAALVRSGDNNSTVAVPLVQIPKASDASDDKAISSATPDSDPLAFPEGDELPSIDRDDTGEAQSDEELAMEGLEYDPDSDEWLDPHDDVED